MSENQQSSDRTADQRAVDAAWDRVGAYMESAQSTWDRLARRNFDFWKDVSRSLRSGPVDADSLAANTARAMSVAQETIQDLWLTLVEPPQREVYVQVLPTAFLFFDKVTDPNGTERYAGQDPVHIPVNHERQGELPEKAEITLSGTPTEAGSDPAVAVAALTQRLRAVKNPHDRSYMLETITPNPSKDLIPGTYEGLIYLIKPTLPLANLRIVVEGPPPPVNPDT